MEPRRAVAVVECLHERPVLATAATDASGNYTLDGAGQHQRAFVRAQAHVASTGGGRRRLGHPGAQQLRRQRALRHRWQPIRHGHRGPDAQPERALGLERVRRLYGTRAAAPFAILDTLYAAVQFVVTQGASALRSRRSRFSGAPQNSRRTTGTRRCGWIISTTTGYRRLHRRGARGHLRARRGEHRHGRIRPARHRARVPALPRGPGQPRGHAGRAALARRAARHARGLQRGLRGRVWRHGADDPLYRDSFGATSAGHRFDIERGHGAGARLVQRSRRCSAIVWDLFDAAEMAATWSRSASGRCTEVMRNELRDGMPLTASSVRYGAEDIAGVGHARSTPGVGPRRSWPTTMNAYATTETHDGAVAGRAARVHPARAEWRCGAGLRDDRRRRGRQDRQPAVPELQRAEHRPSISVSPARRAVPDVDRTGHQPLAGRTRRFHDCAGVGCEFADDRAPELGAAAQTRRRRGTTCSKSTITVTWIRTRTPSARPDLHDRHDHRLRIAPCI